MERNHLVFFTVLVATILVPAAAEPSEPSDVAHAWAAEIEAPQLRNVYRVSNELYRGGRLRPAGAALLESMGVKTVVSLRLRRSDWKSVGCANLNHRQIPCKAWRPDECQVVQFLKIATDENCQPVYVYCRHGADRTGMMCAVYRIVVQGWSKEEALCEMAQGPFDYHPIWRRMVQFVEELDVERIRRRVGLQDSPVD